MASSPLEAYGLQVWVYYEAAKYASMFVFCSKATGYFPNLNIFSLTINLLERKNNNNNIKPDEDGLFLADLSGLFFSSIFPDWENVKMYKVIHYPKSLKVFKVLEIEYNLSIRVKGVGNPIKMYQQSKIIFYTKINKYRNKIESDEPYSQTTYIPVYLTISTRGVVIPIHVPPQIFKLSGFWKQLPKDKK